MLNMLSKLPMVEADPLWGVINAFHGDSRPYKMNLVIGVYRDDAGTTPTFEAVKHAEQQLAEQGHCKAYKNLSGNLEFNQGISRFLLGDDSPLLNNHCTIQTVGATGALRLLADFIVQATPHCTVWNTAPAYVNHHPLMSSAGLLVRDFTWQANQHGLDLEKALDDLAHAKPGDVVLLHGSCHNPTGIDPNFSQWKALADFCRTKQLVPLIDMAYQGFGEGVNEDAAGLRHMVEQVDTVLVAASCSKNMGLYCERTGAAMVVTSESKLLPNVQRNLERITRANYSMPPEHGAAIAAQLFSEPQLWLAELESIRQRIAGLRHRLYSELTHLGASSKFDCLVHQRGMFSLLPLNSAQMQRLHQEFGIYGTSNGRINIAGISSQQIPQLAEALHTVSRLS